MALPKLYDRIIWHNDTTPAINEDNLNAMSKGLDDVDDRLIDLAGTIMEDVPEIQHDLEILEPAIENIDVNVERAETAADNAETEALKSEGYALGTQDGVEVTSGEYYQNNAKYYANIANPPIENTVDFTDIITISDAINKAAKDVRLKVEAVQDLHGYNNPWVGGAGKNKQPLIVDDIKSRNVLGTWSGNTYTRDNVSFTLDTDNAGNITSITVNTTGGANDIKDLYLSTATFGDYLTAGQSYKINGTPGAATSNDCYLRIEKGGAGIENIRNDYTFNYGGTSDEQAYYLLVRVAKNAVLSNVKVYPMIRLSTESNIFEPYTNICPISGWDNAKVTRSGKNLLPQYPYAGPVTPNGLTYRRNADYSITVEAGTATGGNSSIAVARGVWLKKGRYKLVGCPSGGSATTYHILLAPKDTGTWFQDTGNGVIFDKETDGTCDIYYVRVMNGVTIPQLLFKPMITTNLDATYDDYEPYHGEEITISLNGTRYGGTLDITSGVLTLTHGYADLGDLTWGKSSGIFYAQVSGKKASDLNAICSSFPIATSLADLTTARNYPNQICIHPTNEYIYFYSEITEDYTTEQFTSFVDGAQFVYPLATPQTIQLTAVEVYLLYGYNTLFGDCGDISLTYDASGIIHIEESKLDTETLKTIAAASSDFADFKARIAAL